MIAFGLGYLIFAIVWLHAIWHEYYCLWPGLIRLCYHVAVRRMARVLLPLAWVTSSLPSMAVHRMARVLLPLAWINLPLLSYGCTPYRASIIVFGLHYLIFAIDGRTSYGASIIAFGLGQCIFVIIWPYTVWRECYCLWPGLPHRRHRMGVCRMARVLLPLAWVNSSSLSYGCTPYGASIIAFGLGYLFLPLYGCTLYGASTVIFGNFCHRTSVSRMARALLPLAWVNYFLLSYGRAPYGASIIAFGLGYFLVAIHGCMSHGVSWVNSSLLSDGRRPYGASIIALGLVQLIFATVWLYVAWREHYCL